MSTEPHPSAEDPVFGRPAPATVRMLHAAHDSPLEHIDLHDWPGGCSPEERERMLHALESGKIIYLPHLFFDLGRERRVLDPLISHGEPKNISFDPRSGAAAGSRLGGDERALAALLRRFGEASQALLAGLFPDYAGHLEMGRASLRPVSIDARRLSYRNDDRRLHVDAFPSQPVQGRRILRVFANLNGAGVARIWRVGGRFTDYAGRFMRRWLMPGAAATLAFLGITKGRRTAYDWLMLSLHDRAKADTAYQHDGALAEILFPAGSTWIVYTDLVPHAAIGGQHALEQTFYLPVAAMRDPELSPLHILEGLTRKCLTG
jgi:hypothetical protein